MSTEYTDAQVTEALLAVVAWGGNQKRARDSLAENGLEIPQTTLHGWITRIHAERYNDLRDKYSEQLEARLVADYRERAFRAADVAGLAIERTEERLAQGKDPDPARTAANLSTVVDKMTRNMLSLSGRPTSIREDRNLNEVLRSLVAMKVLELPEATEVTEELE